MLEVYFLEVS